MRAPSCSTADGVGDLESADVVVRTKAGRASVSYAESVGDQALGAGCGALSDAVFDTTGVRPRTVPFRPERVLAAALAGRAA